MKNREKLLISLLEDRISGIQVGLTINGIDGINPEEIIKQVSKDKNTKIYAVVIGYDNISYEDTEMYCISGQIESAVSWRNDFNKAGRILVFIRGDVEKMHSLGVFDVINKKDLTQYAIDLQISAVRNENVPIKEFWSALKDTSEFYSLQNVEEFINAVNADPDKTSGIAKNLWRLNLLCDDSILAQKANRKERLKTNHTMIIDISQISENGRRNLSRSLSRASDEDKKELQDAYRLVEEYFQYGKRETLKNLDFSVVGNLLSSTTSKKKNPPAPSPGQGPDVLGGDTDPTTGIDEPPKPPKVLKNKDIDEIIANQFLFGTDETMEDVIDFYNRLKDGYADESTSKISIQESGDIFHNAPIELDKHLDKLREIVGEFCSSSSWGGILESKELEIKDAIAATAVSTKPFSPDTFYYPANHKSLYSFLDEFDSNFGFEDSFKSIFDTIITTRTKLCGYIDLLMHQPFVLLRADEEARNTLAGYIEAWGKIYELYSRHAKEMSSYSDGPTAFIGRGLIALDVLYVHTGDNKWKAILLPLHPLYLWSYYEIAKTVLMDREPLGKSELTDLKSVLLEPPQMLNYIAVDRGLTSDNKDIILPCSGSIQMLPTYENSTNRFLGDDGLDSIRDVLERWIRFAPFSTNEIRISTLDAPNLSYIIKQIADFIDKNDVDNFVYDVFYSRGQNGNTELSGLDYSDRDQLIGDMIKTGKLTLRVHSVSSPSDVHNYLSKKPVHIAFYFDQSKYNVQEKPDDGKLYSNPFVVTYDFSYDKIMHTGTISPSSRSQTGILGDYHSIMVAAQYLNENRSPWLCIDPSDSTDHILNGIKNNDCQWIVIADRNIGNYEIKDEYDLIPIGEKVYNRRRVGIWASKNSRIIKQYCHDLKNYSLSPNEDKLVEIIKSFGHIAAAGLISIPKVGFDSSATWYRQKGLLGTLFAATWYSQRESTNNDSVMVASLDSDKARVWLTTRDEDSEDEDKKSKQERADLVGLKYSKDTDTLYVQPIEVKTRDEQNPSQYDYELYCDEYGNNKLRKHAPKQVANIVKILRDVFSVDESEGTKFIAARKEVLKYQIITECFRNVHDKEWQQLWHSVLSRAFDKSERQGLKIEVSGILVYIHLGNSTTRDSKPIYCTYDGEGNYPIELSILSSNDIQKQIFDVGTAQTDSLSTDVTVDDESDVPSILADAIEDASSHDGGDDSFMELESITIEPTTESVALNGYEPTKNEGATTLNTSSTGIVEPEEIVVPTESLQDKVTQLSDVRLLLGTEPRSGEKFYWEFGNKKLSNRHLLINGNSGCGKTYCIEALLMEACQQGISAVVFDYTGGFTSKKLEPTFKSTLGDRIKQRLVRMDKIPINPFERHEIEVDDGCTIPEDNVDIASKIAESFAAVYDFGDQQKNTVYSAVVSGLEKYGDKMNFKLMAQELDTINNSYSKTALSKIQQFIDLDPFVPGEAFDWSDIRDSGGMVYIIQFIGYVRDVQVMLTELLLWDLWSFSTKHGNEDHPFICVIDEAQNLSHKEKSPSGLLLTEGRKYGLSGWYATQFMKPQLTDDEIQRLQQADQKLYFCPPGDGVLTVAKNIDITTQGTKEWADKLQRLNKGECVTCGSMMRSGKWHKYEPRIIKITSLEERIK